MKEFIQHSIYGEIVYNESFWTGKKTLTVNGINSKRISKKEYMINEKTAILKGNYYTGVFLYIDDERIELSPKPTWYEMILSLLSLFFLLTWGNSPTLCAIFPVVGGAIGGLLGGVGLISSSFFMRKQKKPIIKIIIGIVSTFLTVFIAFLLACMLINILA